MKKIFTRVLLFMLTLSLVACGSKDSTSEQNDSTVSEQSESKSGSETADHQDAESDEKVVLDVLWFTDGIETQVMEEIMADYTALNPNIEFNMIEVGFNDLEAKLKTMIAGGQAPALGRITNPGLLFNQTVDIAPQLGGYEEVTSQYMESLAPYYSKDGQVFGVPMDVTANGLIYNKTLFDQAGVEVPASEEEIWTWEEFEEAIQTVVDNTDARYGLIWDNSPHRWSTLMYQFDGQFINDEGTQAVVNEPNAVEALTYFKELHEKGIIPESIWLGGENPNNLFRSGTAAAHFSGNWMVSSYRDIEDFEWGVTYMPKATTRSSVPGGKYLMAFQNTGVEEEAVDFIKYFMSPEVTGKYCSESFFLSPRLDNSDLTYEFGSEMFTVFSNELANTPDNAALDWSKQHIIPAVYSDITEAIISALIEEQTPQEAFDDLAETINEVIEEKN